MLRWTNTRATQIKGANGKSAATTAPARPAYIPWRHGAAATPRFVCDVMLEGLARQMRLFGLDALSMEQRARRQRPHLVRRAVYAMLLSLLWCSTQQ
jgi:Mut7-C RNAse domain